MWTLITVTFNSEKVLARNFDRAPQGVRRLVVDNASSDESVNVAADRGAEVIQLDSNCGFSAANNIALSKSDTDLVAFVNPDVRVDYSRLDTLARSVKRLGGLVAPQLAYPDGSLQPNGRQLPFLTRKVSNRLSSKRSDYFRIATPGEVIRVAWAIGAAVSGTRSTFVKLGGWDERFFVYYEDSELGLRAWESGLPFHVLGDVVWTHEWARETTTVKWPAWKREIASASRFYFRRPELLAPGPWARNRYRRGAIEGLS
jgi:GT2 family glycosyltransferase